MHKVFIHQPDFAPHPSYFKRLNWADVVVLLDDVQFARRGWTHRDIVFDDFGVSRQISLQVKKCHRSSAISTVELDQPNELIPRLLEKIMFWYRSSPFSCELIELLENIQPFKYLADFNISVLYLVCERLEIEFAPKFSSQFNIRETGQKRICELLVRTNASEYISGKGIYSYFEHLNFFESNQVKLLIDENNLDPNWVGYDRNLSIFHYIAVAGFAELKRWMVEGKYE